MGVLYNEKLLSFFPKVLPALGCSVLLGLINPTGLMRGSCSLCSLGMGLQQSREEQGTEI